MEVDPGSTLFSSSGHAWFRFCGRKPAFTGAQSPVSSEISELIVQRSSTDSLWTSWFPVSLAKLLILLGGDSQEVFQPLGRPGVGRAVRSPALRVCLALPRRAPVWVSALPSTLSLPSTLRSQDRRAGRSAARSEPFLRH